MTDVWESEGGSVNMKYEEVLDLLKEDVRICQEAVVRAQNTLYEAEVDLEEAEAELRRFELNGEF